MTHHGKSLSDVKLLNDKIKGIHVAMLTTMDADGKLHSRPMVTQEEDFDGDLWFFTYDNAPKVGNVAVHPEVNLSYVKESDNLYVSVSGTAELVRDRKKMDDLWKPRLKTWFPNGTGDPHLALLKVHVESAEIWDIPSGKMGRLYSAVRSLATGGKEVITEDIKLDMK
jgi:general stress protein 26